MRVFLAANGSLAPIGTCAPKHILSAARGIHPSGSSVRRVATTSTGWKTCTDSDVTTGPETIERAVVVGSWEETERVPGWVVDREYAMQQISDCCQEQDAAEAGSMREGV